MDQLDNLRINSVITLNDGVQMPRFGLGTARMTDPEIVSRAVSKAIQYGYRLIDTSKNYENEQPVGRGIRESGVPENQIFLVTKLEKEDYGFEEAQHGFEGSLARLGISKIDLYLIHAPENDRQARIEAWRGMIALLKTGRLHSIGVSNYEIEHLEEIQREGLALPSVNQIELTPYNYQDQRALVEYCQRHAIQIMAYSPLGVGDLLTEPRLMDIARRYRKTTAQLLLRWALQHHFIVIPKSEKEEHIRENADVFDFTIAVEDMEKMDHM